MSIDELTEGELKSLVGFFDVLLQIDQGYKSGEEGEKEIS